MKGALRVAVLLLSALRIQKWLLGIGAVLIIAGYLVPTRVFRVFALLGVILPLVPCLFAGGLLLRYFVAPRSIRLIPHARAQILGGMALFAFAVTTVGALAAANFLGAALLPLVWLRIAAATSVLMLSQFLLVSNALGVMLWMVMFVALVQSTLLPSVRQILLSIGQEPRFLGVIVIVTWGAFALWFLRTPVLNGMSDLNPPGKRALKVRTTPATAVRVFLSGDPSWLNALRSQLVGAVFVILCWGSLFAIMGRLTLADAMIKAMGAAMGLTAYSGISGWLVARRSKMLWLRGGLDRMGLFHLCEKQAWRCFGVMAAPMVGLFVGACLLKPSVAVGYTVMLAFHFCAGMCLLYLGLMHVQGWRGVDIICGTVLFLVWIISFVTTQLVLEIPWLLPVLIGAFLGVAFGLRTAAMRRWQHIDWLVCKQTRPPARDEVRAM